MAQPQARTQSQPQVATTSRRGGAPTEPAPRYRCSICRKFTDDIDVHLVQSHPR